MSETAAAANRPLFVSTIVHWEDDYKRADSYTTYVGLYTTKHAAWRAAWIQEMTSNAEYTDEDEKSKEPYLLRYKDVVAIASDEQMEALKDAMLENREAYLGEHGEFTMYASGYRARVEEIVGLDPPALVEERDLKAEKSLLKWVFDEGADEPEGDENEEEAEGEEGLDADNISKKAKGSDDDA